MKYIFQFFFFLCFTSCELIDYHPYDGRIDCDVDINKNNMKLISERCQNKDTICFAMMGDTQRSYDETELFVKHINSRSDIDFVIHGGDISDFGTKKEFEWVHRIMKKMSVPYVALIGNHDVIGNGYHVYDKMYGADNFSFIVSGVKFLCLNTNAIEYDYSHPVPDFNFIDTELHNGDFEKTIVVMHAPPGCEQFNNNVKTIFQRYLTNYPNLLFCTNAHGHSTSVNDLFDDGVIYYQCACINKRSYLKFKIYSDGYKYEETFF
ncbi:MAG: metallophosphoesterase [Rikenellaceae bacterium]